MAANTALKASGLLAAIRAVLADGEWHQVDEFVTAIRPLTRPEVLYRLHKNTCYQVRVVGGPCTHDAVWAQQSALRRKAQILVAEIPGVERGGTRGMRTWRMG